MKREDLDTVLIEKIHDLAWLVTWMIYFTFNVRHTREVKYLFAIWVLVQQKNVADPSPDRNCKHNGKGMEALKSTKKDRLVSK